MRVLTTDVNDVLIVESPIFTDERGFFIEVFHADKFAALGLPTDFAQDNQSRSAKGVLRGLHFQRENAQCKLVRPAYGKIFDVAVDLRESSSSFGKWFGLVLEAGDGRQLYIPAGMAHGFYVLSESADVSYKCTTSYHGPSDSALLWNDPTVGIDWPIAKNESPLLSAKDRAAPQFTAVLPFP